MLFGPTYLANRQVEQLESSAEMMTQMVSDIIQDSGWNAEGDSLESVLGTMRKIHKLTYLVLTDEQGRVISSVNEVGAQRLNYRRPKESFPDFKKSGTVRTTQSVLLPNSRKSILYLGLSDPQFADTLREYRRDSILAGLALLLLSAGLFYSLRTVTVMESHIYSLRRTQKDLSVQKGTLQSKVDEHQKTAAELKESEQRYRYLLENAMTSAFSDLEALNKNLERQKAELEVEVDQKTKAQSELATYADRLSSLNAIERLLVSEESLKIIVDNALQQIQKLIHCNYATILQVNRDSSEVITLGSCGEGLLGAPLNDAFEPDGMRQPGDSWLYIPDLSKQSSRSEVEQKLVDNNLLSYGRATLTIGDALVGSLIVCGEHQDAFSASDITAVRDIADLISLGLSQQQHRMERERYEQELITERDRAEEMARLKTAFLANMSHEIRTPLSGIIGFAQVLHEEVGLDQQEFTGLIQDAAKRLLNTINSVLDLSKLEALKVPLQIDLADFTEVVEESLALLKPLAVKKNIGFHIQVQSGLSCRLDRGAIQSIVNNVVGNAIKFTAEGEVKIEIGHSEEGAYLKVEDRGVGISPYFIPYLFDEFRQEHMGSDRPHEGSGLGLAITHKLVTRLGGRIEVASEPGKGTRFDVFLPSDPANLPVIEKPQKNTKAKTAQDRSSLQSEPEWKSGAAKSSVSS